MVFIKDVLDDVDSVPDCLQLTDHIWRNIRKLKEKYNIPWRTMQDAGVKVNPWSRSNYGYSIYAVVQFASFFGVSLDDIVFKTFYEEKDVRRWEEKRFSRK